VVFPSTLKPLAIHVQLVNRLSLIPGWAGFAAPKPELGVEQRGLDGVPFFISPALIFAILLI